MEDVTSYKRRESLSSIFGSETLMRFEDKLSVRFFTIVIWKLKDLQRAGSSEIYKGLMWSGTVYILIVKGVVAVSIR